MSELSSTKPYMLRAIHEWCVDNGLTPHLLVAVNSQTRVPMAYVKNGEIVLNLSYAATKDMLIANEAISFSARFSGASQNLYIPMNAVKGIFSRENGQGMFFQDEDGKNPEKNQNDVSSSELEAVKKDADDPTKPKKPGLKLVK